MGEIVYINGKFFEPKSAAVPVLDNGYLYGDGIFETLRSYAGHIFNLEPHLQRLFEASRSLYLPVPLDPLPLTRKVVQTLKKSGLLDTYIRITLTRGVNGGGFHSMNFKKPTLSIMVRPFSEYPKRLYRRGIKTTILTSPSICPGSEKAHIKSCNYQKNILARFELKRLNYMEGILLDHKGSLSEGTISNLFIVKKGVLYTPSLNSGCLKGVTRQTVLRFAKEKTSLHVKEATLKPGDIYRADECFFTNSLLELLPAVKVGEKVIGNGKPGKFTIMLHRGYKNLINASRASGLNIR